MTYFDTTYTTGVIAVKEKRLLQDKLFHLAELGVDEAFRILLDAGFGGGAETTTSLYDFEKLIAVEERDVDEFIRVYTPSDTESAYLLSARDFHNAKALVKAGYLQRDAAEMLSPEGLIPIDVLSGCVQTGDFSALTILNAYLGRACEDATAILKQQASGALVGDIFEKALYAYLAEKTKKKKTLKNLLATKVDMKNILTALRSKDEEVAEKKYLSGGNLSKEQLSKLFLSDDERVAEAFYNTPYVAFIKTALSERGLSLPFTQVEKMIDGLETEYFSKRKYELKKSEPFLYYVYRRRAENANVRIVFVCLLAGLSEQEIKKRLRAW